MKKAIMNIMLITVLAKMLGFAREILLSYYFGASGISDAYLISQTIPGTIFQFVGAGLMTSFIPVYLSVFSKQGKGEADKFTNTVISMVLIFSTIIIILLWVFPYQIVGAFASGFQGETLEYAVTFTKIGILSLYFSSLIYVFTSYLQANNSFTIIALAAIPNSVMIMLSIFLGSKVNLTLLSVGSVVAVFIQLFFIWTQIYKTKFRVRLNFQFKSPYIKEIYLLMLPVIAGISVNQINVLINKTIASRISTGGVSALSYADSLIMFVQGVFAQTIATVYYPTITRLVAENKETELKVTISELLEGMLYLLLPMSVGTMLLSTPVVNILYGRGAFNENAIVMTSQVLGFYAVGILGYGFREILSRIFYAFHDTKTPMMNATLGMVLNIILSILFSRYIGIGGLALGTSLSSIITSILLIIHLKKKMRTFFSSKLLKNYLKIGLATGIMGICVFFMYETAFYGMNLYIRTIGSVVVGIMAYLGLSIALKIEIFTNLVNILMRKIGFKVKEKGEL